MSSTLFAIPCLYLRSLRRPRVAPAHDKSMDYQRGRRVALLGQEECFMPIVDVLMGSFQRGLSFLAVGCHLDSSRLCIGNE
jgi:hypothetical protein